MDVDEDEGPFRYRSGVRVIAVSDVVLSVYLLVYFAVMVFILDIKDTDIPQMESKEMHRNITVGVWIILFLLHLLQLVFALILVCGSNDGDAAISRYKCQLWLYYSNFLCFALFLEVLLLVLNFSRHGMRVYPMAMWGVKVIFRLIARQLVLHYIKDLDKVPLNTVEAQFYAGLPRMHQYSGEYLGAPTKAASAGSIGKKK